MRPMDHIRSQPSGLALRALSATYPIDINAADFMFNAILFDGGGGGQLDDEKIIRRGFGHGDGDNFGFGDGPTRASQAELRFVHAGTIGHHQNDVQIGVKFVLALCNGTIHTRYLSGGRW